MTQPSPRRALCVSQAPPPSNLRGDAYCRACVGAGLLQLAQLPHAVPADLCPGKEAGKGPRLCAAAAACPSRRCRVRPAPPPPPPLLLTPPTPLFPVPSPFFLALLQRCCFWTCAA